MNLFAIYKKFPKGIRDFSKIAYGAIPLRWRIPNSFVAQLKCIETSQWWSERELENYQNEELQRLIHHAYKNVPYYNKLFKANNLSPDNIKSASDLHKLPILKKDEVRTHLSELRATNFTDRKVVTYTTSGTTGKPLRVYYDRDKQYFDFDPFTIRFFEWGGYHLGELIAAMLNWSLEKDDYYSYNPVRRLLILSSYRLNQENVDEYLRLLENYKIRYLSGYPSIIGLLTRFAKTKGIKCPLNLKAIFFFGEEYPLSQRNVIEEFWGCKCFTNYSLRERCILGVECEEHSGLHLCSDFGITEFLDSEIEGYKRIIATSLTNFALPLIRYDTGDIGRLIQERCRCKRGFPLFELQGGRTRNFAITKNDSYAPISGIDLGGVTENILQYQFVQEKKGELTLNIVKRDTFQEKDLDRIRSLLNEKLGKNMDVNITFTNTVDTTPSYKNPRFIQKIKDGMPC